MNEHRINARVDAVTTRQLEELTEATGLNVSHVVREAIAVYHAQLKTTQRPRPRRLLAMVGKYSSGHSDGSTRYKEIIGELLEQKWALTQVEAPRPEPKPEKRTATPRRPR